MHHFVPLLPKFSKPEPLPKLKSGLYVHLTVKLVGRTTMSWKEKIKLADAVSEVCMRQYSQCTQVTSLAVSLIAWPEICTPTVCSCL